jgi:L-asparaginase II
MSSPVVATVWRSGRTESLHRGAGAVADGSGARLASFGDPEAPIYWRSAAKPFQAMPFLEARGDEAFSLTDQEIALACASHSGEPRHVDAARALLARGNFSEGDLRCGAQPPHNEEAAAALVRSGVGFSAVHNNCSGKHAAMLLACRLMGFDPATYDQPAHPLQQLIRKKVAFYAGAPDEGIEVGVDGCSLPVFRLSLLHLATAYARLMVAARLPGESAREEVIRHRIVAAMTGNPYFVSGTGQFTNAFLAAGRGHWLGKEGAEGVYAVGLAGPSPRGFAFKIEDGGSRGRNPVTIDLMKKVGAFDGDVPEGLAAFARPAVKNARGLAVGEIVADVPLELAGRQR